MCVDFALDVGECVYLCVPISFSFEPYTFRRSVHVRVCVCKGVLRIEVRNVDCMRDVGPCQCVVLCFSLGFFVSACVCV